MDHPPVLNFVSFLFCDSHLLAFLVSSRCSFPHSRASPSLTLKSLCIRTPAQGHFSQMSTWLCYHLCAWAQHAYFYRRQFLWDSDIQFDHIICIFQNSTTPNWTIPLLQLPQTWHCSGVSCLRGKHQPQDSQQKPRTPPDASLSSYPTATTCWQLLLLNSSLLPSLPAFKSKLNLDHLLLRLLQ